MADMMNMTVTTLDLHTGYEVIGPVCGSSLSQSDPDQAFLGALRQIRKSAALLDADAVIGLRQSAVPVGDGSGRFHVQLYGTAVRETAQALPESPAAGAVIGTIGKSGRQEGDFLMDGSTLVRYVGQSEYVRVPDGVINIGAEAFHNARVVSVELPDSVTEIREGAFSPELYFSVGYRASRQPAGDRQGGLFRMPRAARSHRIYAAQGGRGQRRRVSAQQTSCLETPGPLPVLRRLLQGRSQGRQGLQHVRYGKGLLM